jgi:hypothetical protein
MEIDVPKLAVFLVIWLAWCVAGHYISRWLLMRKLDAIERMRRSG